MTTTIFLDFIVFAEYKFKIRGEDDDGDKDEGDLKILPSNSAPTILIVPSPVDVLETQTSKSLLTSITAMDIDPGDTPSYSSSSSPNGPFSVDNNGKYHKYPVQSRITFNYSLSFELSIDMIRVLHDVDIHFQTCFACDLPNCADLLNSSKYTVRDYTLYKYCFFPPKFMVASVTATYKHKIR